MFAAATAVAATLSDSIKIDDLTLNFLIGAVVPLLVGLVTKLRASSGLKAVINFGFSAVTGVLTSMLGGGTLTAKEIITKIFVTWISAIVAYEGLQKPTGVAGTVASIAPSLGIGKPQMETEDKGAEDVGETATNLDELQHDELYKLAQAADIKGRTKMTDAQLREALRS